MPLRKSTASRCKYTSRSTARRNIAAPQRFNHRTDQLRVLTQALKGQSHAIGQIGIEPGGLRRIRPFASGLAQGRHTSRPLSYCGSAFVLNDRYKRREFLCPVLHDALLSRSPVSPNPFMQQVCVHSMRNPEASYRHARLQARFYQPALRLRIKYPTAISLHSDYWQSITYRFIHVLGCPLSIGWTPILRFYPAMRQVQKIERLRSDCVSSSSRLNLSVGAQQPHQSDVSLLAASPCTWLSHAPSTLSQSAFCCTLRLSSSLSTCPVVLPDFSGSGRMQQISQVHIDPISYHAVASDPRSSKCLLASAQAFVLSSAAMKASTSITSVFTGLNTFTCVTA